MQPLLALKLRNQILALNDELTVQLSNIGINGTKVGCSGFVTDPGAGRVLYINTDHNHGTNRDRAFYRVARDVKDYRGGVNHFSDYGDLAKEALELLNSDRFDRELAAR